MSQKTKYIYIFKDIKTHLKHEQLKILKKIWQSHKKIHFYSKCLNLAQFCLNLAVLLIRWIFRLTL